MYPTLLSIGDSLHFHAYTVALSTAFLVAVLLSVRENYKLDSPHAITPIGGLWVFAGALLGAKIYWIVQYGTPEIYWQALTFRAGGLVFYGGLFGGLAAGIAYVKFCRAPILEVGDIAIPFVPLAHAIARVGCFLNGCCYGSLTGMPWGVQFPPLSGPYNAQLRAGLIENGAAHSLAVHPTQLYSTANLFLLFLILRFVYKRHTRAGSVLFLYPVLYGIHRFIVEAFRGDSARPVFDLLTVSQVVALGLIVFGLAGYAVLAATRGRAPSAPPSAEV